MAYTELISAAGKPYVSILHRYGRILDVKVTGLFEEAVQDCLVISMGSFFLLTLKSWNFKS